MKKALLSIALSAFVFSLIAGTGLSADSPLTVSQALAKKNDRKSYYINGHVVGEYETTPTINTSTTLHRPSMEPRPTSSPTKSMKSI